MINATQISELREKTGAGVMDCKRALQEAEGDMDRAVELIKKKGLIKAQKRRERETGAGLLESYMHNGRVGVLLEMRCETDFVAHSEPFQNCAHELAMHIAAMDPHDVEQLLQQQFVKDESRTIHDLVNDVIAKTGENVRVSRFSRYEL